LELKAADLLLHTLQVLINLPKIKSVFLVHTDSSQQEYLEFFENHQEKIQKINFIDCYSDPLEWDRGQTLHQSLACKYERCSLEGLERFLGRLSQASESVGQSVLVVDNLSTLILHCNYNTLPFALFLKKLAQIVKACFTASLFLIHEDLHSEFEINCLLSFCTSFVRVLSPSESDAAHITGALHIVEKLQKGKSLKIKEYFKVTSPRSVKFLSVSELAKLRSSQDEKSKSQKASEPFDELTFDVSLTEEQKKAKEAVILPYVHQGQKPQSKPSDNTKLFGDESKEGTIYIDADDDAFEASDPDEDLDI